MPAANIPPMVSASAPSPLEINLRRLMAKCDAKVRGSDKILQGSERTKFMMNIKMLRELLVDLEDEIKLSTKGEVAVELKEYVQKIDSLESVLDGSMPTQSSSRGFSQTRMITPASYADSAIVGSFGSGVEREMRSKSETGQALPQSTAEDLHISPSNRTDELLGLRERSSPMISGISRTGSSSIRIENSHRQNGLRVSESKDALREQSQVEAALQNDRAQREEMEAGLSMLMQQLRHNAMAIHQTLTDEQKSGLLDDADQALDNNISRLGKERARLELYSKQSRKTKWLILGIVLGVSLVFVFMFFIIRIF
ncbi:hypothetical protein BGX27_000974 [Mortierella sp. AM989]|nr:hypothetical protein BGX27_000974 [Mortierella sp. AM989]